DAVMDLALQTLKALSYLASQGISHRDLKPSKIIVFRTDPPLFKLTEFGGEDLIDARQYLADRIADDTIDYVAPEIFERGAGALPSKTDVWSLGIIMWELLVGTSPVPFLEDLNYMSCFRAILNWQPRVKELQEYGVSDEGQELLMRLVERAPKFRPDVETLKGDECFDYLEYVRKNEPCE
ncbi:kinase-like protein, partial [Aureobasidium melanogenum]